MAMKTLLLWMFGAIFFLVGCSTGRDNATPLPTAIFAQTTATPLPTPPLHPALTAAPTLSVPATITPTPLPTATPLPSPTPLPTERAALAATAAALDDFAAAAEQLEGLLNDPAGLPPALQPQTRYDLGLAYFNDGQYQPAVDTFNHYLAEAATLEGLDVSSAYFYLAESYKALGNWAAAIGAYQSYLTANPDMVAFIQPLIGDCQLAQGDNAAAIAADQTALTGRAHRLTLVSIHLTLADLYRSQAAYAQAATHYEAIYNLALTAETRAEMSYLAGSMLIQAGDPAGYDRYLRNLNEYPQSYNSYLGLIELVTAGYGVDSYLRGVVDYYAAAYEPAVTALTAAISLEGYNPEAHLYLAWSYQGLGNLALAFTQLENYGTATGDTARVALETARLYERAAQFEQARDGYLAFVAAYPDHAEAPAAAYWAAALTAHIGDGALAVSLYQQMAVAYPAGADTPQALFTAGELAYQAGNVLTATIIWQQLLANYPTSEQAPAGLLWLLRSDPTNPTYILTATQSLATDYYSLRAKEFAAGQQPFTAPAGDTLNLDMTAGQAEADLWLQNWLGLAEGSNISTLDPLLASDERLARGQKLWQLGLLALARREMDGLRADYATNILFSYQLAIFFRDIGLYRSSILAANAVLALTDQTAFTAPPFIGRLAYPAYYADLVLPLAEQYGYDPLLQFSLLRQESLFESFISSSVGAQGLSQVMPATGDYIAGRLGWPNYETADLLRPAVGLAFGAYYLAEQLQTFEGDIYAALSAYNAGPGNAARWLDAAGHDPDLYLETINFNETRIYIERIYVNYLIYRFLYE